MERTVLARDKQGNLVTYKTETESRPARLKECRDRGMMYVTSHQDSSKIELLKARQEKAIRG